MGLSNYLIDVAIELCQEDYFTAVEDTIPFVSNNLAEWVSPIGVDNAGVVSVDLERGVDQFCRSAPLILLVTGPCAVGSQPLQMKRWNVLTK